MIKTTGAEFWRFYHDDIFWPDGSYHDDSLVRVNGEEVEDYTRDSIPDDAKIEIEAGVVVFEDGDEVSLESHFKKWRKAQNTASIVVECPKDKLDAVKAAIKASGGRVA
jgi:hypothetical protein